MIKIKPSHKNTNLHTEAGMQLLENSIDKVGVLESISVTTDGKIISGHARKEIFEKKNLVAKEIHLQQNEYPVIVTDIENNSKKYFEAQILANTTANKNFNLDNELIEEIAVEYDIDVEDLNLDIEPILIQINQHLSIPHFNHYRPANQLVKQGLSAKDFDISTIENFAKVIIEINKLFK